MAIIINFGTIFVEPDFYEVLSGASLHMPAAFGLLLNDYATLGGLQLTSYSQSADGTVIAASDGSFTYTPSPGFSGVDTFTYKAGAGIRSGTATVTVDVHQPLLVATPDVFAALPGQTLIVSGVNALLGNDFTNAGTIVATSFSSPSNGMLSVSLTGDITYVPDSGFVGADSFTYDIGNGTETSYAVATTEVVACFRAGTRIATPDGEVAVEALRVGQMLRTASGGSRPVRWIGRRRIACARHAAAHPAHPHRRRRLRRGSAQPGAVSVTGSCRVPGRRADPDRRTGKRHHHPPGRNGHRRLLPGGAGPARRHPGRGPARRKLPGQRQPQRF